MRPVNLIPEEQRRARDGASRTGPLAYIVVGSLLLLLVGVVMMVLSSNQISDRKAEIADLNAQKARATARAERLMPYANFKLVADQRTLTVASLADSRFDWVRVIRQLSLIVPPHVWLNTMTGSAGGAGEEATSIAGPSLSLSGCARGQNTVAAFVAALKEIDGVTRVGLEDSRLASTGAGGASAPGEGGCAGASFSLVIAFDAAPPSPNGGAVAEEAPSEEAGASAEPETDATGATGAAPSSETAEAG